jgi:hypothetical protein
VEFWEIFFSEIQTRGDEREVPGLKAGNLLSSYPFTRKAKA